MKNYENTRAKIKNYLIALKQRFNNIQFKEYNREMTKEFGVSATIPGLLKNGNYIEFENKYLKLNPSINTLNEIDLHTMVLNYCNDSKRKINIRKEKQRVRKLKKAEKLKQLQEQSKPQTFTMDEIKGKLKNDPEYTHFFKNKVGRPKSKIQKPIETPFILKELLKDTAFAKLYKDAPTLNNCKNCNKSFKASRTNNKYCSIYCRSKYHNTKYYNNLSKRAENYELSKVKYQNPKEAENHSIANNKLDVLESKLQSLDKLITLHSKGAITIKEMENLKKAILS
jgi:hypothetical protein